MGFLDFIRKKKPTPKIDWTKPLPVPDIQKVIEGKRYTSLDAKCLAQGIGMFSMCYLWLMQTNNGGFFYIYRNLLGQDSIVPIDQEAAMSAFSSLTYPEVKFEQAFPDIKIVDA